MREEKSVNAARAARSKIAPESPTLAPGLCGKERVHGYGIHTFHPLLCTR